MSLRYTVVGQRDGKEIREYQADLLSDIFSLPTDIATWSTCFVLESGGVNKLDTDNIWKLITNETIPIESLAEAKSYTDEIASAINLAKVDKVTGKDLSTNDFTTLEKNKIVNVDTRLKDIYINVKDYGAVGDYGTSNTNDSASIAIAIAALSDGCVLYFPPCEGYCTSSTTTIPPGISVIMEAPILYTGSGISINVGTAGVENRNRHFKLWTEKTVQSNWSSEDCIGIKMINCVNCDIEIVASSYFTIGLQCIGLGASVEAPLKNAFAYNHVKLGILSENKIGLDLTSENSGWCNESLWLGGWFSCWISNGLTRYGIRLTQGSNTTWYCDNNIFIKPCFELIVGNASPGLAIPILADYAIMNHFQNIRTEENSQAIAVFNNNSTGNTISIGSADYLETPVGLHTIEDNTGNGTNVLINPLTDMINNRPSILIFDSGNLAEKSNVFSYDSVSVPPVLQVYTQGINYLKRNPATTLKAGDKVQIRDDHIYVVNTTSASYPFIRVDTSKRKKYVVHVDYKVEKTRIAIACFNSEGVRLTSADAHHPYCKGYDHNSTQYDTIMGGTYLQESGAAGSSLYFNLHEDVKSIMIIVLAYPGVLRLKRFSVYAITDSNIDAMLPTVYLDYITPNHLTASVVPTNGKWEQGQVVYATDPITAGCIGWVCSASGTFKTSGDWTAGTKYYDGQTVKTTANKLLQVINRTTGFAGTVEPSPTAIGEVVVDNAVTWEYVSDYIADPTFLEFGVIT